GRCITHDLWVSLNTKVLDYLDGLSLQDLIDGQKDRNKTITFSKNIKKNNEVKIGAT
ncbi:MAG: DNA-binding protein, partial [Nitrosomonadales bacterium]|nr:DNA-binding protein [Nitrosomonadales bacterium]